MTYDWSLSYFLAQFFHWTFKQFSYANCVCFRNDVDRHRSPGTCRICACAILCHCSFLESINCPSVNCPRVDVSLLTLCIGMCTCWFEVGFICSIRSYMSSRLVYDIILLFVSRSFDLLPHKRRDLMLVWNIHVVSYSIPLTSWDGLENVFSLV